MQYLSIYQVRKEKDLPKVYNPSYESMIIEGTKIMPNDTELTFFANGHNDKSSFLSTYIEKCTDGTKMNPLYKDLSFNKVKCADEKDIDKFIKKLNVEFYFSYYDIDIQEKNFTDTMFYTSKMILRTTLDTTK